MVIDVTGIPAPT